MDQTTSRDVEISKAWLEVRLAQLDVLVREEEHARTMRELEEFMAQDNFAGASQVEETNLAPRPDNQIMTGPFRHTPTWASDQNAAKNHHLPGDNSVWDIMAEHAPPLLMNAAFEEAEDANDASQADPHIASAPQQPLMHIGPPSTPDDAAIPGPSTSGSSPTHGYAEFWTPTRPPVTGSVRHPPLLKAARKSSHKKQMIPGCYTFDLHPLAKRAPRSKTKE